MENPIGGEVAICSEGEWSSLSGMFTTEEADFMAQLLGNFDSGSIPSNHFWSIDESTTMPASFFTYSQESWPRDVDDGCKMTDGVMENKNNQQSYPSILIDNISSCSLSMDLCLGDTAMNTSSFLIDGDDFCNVESKSGRNRKENAVADEDLQQIQSPQEKGKHNSSENSKKRCRNSGDAPKNRRNVRSKKSKNMDEENNGGGNVPASSGCCSEDDSNVSHELNGSGVSSSSLSSKGTPALNLNGKTRASRGAATDPQSLYARKRRERINERLKILQNLVPNGTKVDISTMLEEAVQYVKFLQLQIKLLSSDDLWMYAPLAYNGMDIGIDLKLTTPSQSPR